MSSAPVGWAWPKSSTAAHPMENDVPLPPVDFLPLAVEKRNYESDHATLTIVLREKVAFGGDFVHPA
jgi:hypothetical protein